MFRGNTAYCSVKLSGEDLSRYSHKIESLGLRKYPFMTVSLILLKKWCHNNKRFSELAAHHGGKPHRCGMRKLRHCHSLGSVTVGRCVTENVFLLWIFPTCDRELWLMTLTFELDPDRITMNHVAKYLGQRSFRSKVILRRHTHTHTHRGHTALRGPLQRSMVAFQFCAVLCRSRSSFSVYLIQRRRQYLLRGDTKLRESYLSRIKRHIEQGSVYD